MSMEAQSPGHIFVPTSPDAGLASEMICRDLVAHGTAPDRILIVWMLGHVRPASMPEHVRIVAGPADALINGNLWREVRKRFALAQWWRAVLRDHSDLIGTHAHWYINHAELIPANDGFYRARRASLSLLPDGLLGFTDADVRPTGAATTMRRTAQHVCTMIAATMAGLTYRPLWRGHLTRYESGPYDRTYTFQMRGLIARSGEVITLDRPVLSARARDPKIAIIADQPLAGLISADEDRKLSRAMVDMLNERPLDWVYYKAHPRGGDRMDMFAQMLRHRTVAAPQGMSVEEAAAQLGAGVLTSFWSTALVTQGQDTGIERIAVLPVAGQGSQAQLVGDVRARFADLGVGIVDVDLAADQPIERARHQPSA